MQIKQLFDDDQAVSPVIGVILMVAITVILAAVIGTFVLGLGDQVQSSAPNANFQFEYSNIGDGTSDNDVFEITHNGGQDIDRENVDVLIEGTDASTTSGSINDFSTTISTGSSYTFDENSNDIFSGGDTIRVVWQSDSGSSSNTIGQSEVPS